MSLAYKTIASRAAAGTLALGLCLGLSTAADARDYSSYGNNYPAPYTANQDNHSWKSKRHYGQSKRLHWRAPHKYSYVEVIRRGPWKIWRRVTIVKPHWGGPSRRYVVNLRREWAGRPGKRLVY